MSQEQYQLEMKNICKRFGPVYALKDVSISVKRGEIHALVGENGAGKSTLIKILSGAYTKDSGEIYIDGKKVEITSTIDAKRLGIAVIYQEFMLAKDLSVTENIFIDHLSDRGILINWKKLRRDAGKLLEDLGFSDIPVDAKVQDLSVAHQQVVEICKCLTHKSRILVLDEPTAVLTVAEIARLFRVVRLLKENGVSIIYISHHMNEIFELCDTATIMKDGQYVGTTPTAEVTTDSLIHMMIGREMTQMFPQRTPNIGEAVLEVSNLSSGTMVKKVDFKAHAGEILGFSGLVGSGRTEAMRAIFGANKRDSGTVILNGKPVSFKSPREAVMGGLGYLSEDRKGLGLLVNQSIRVNTTISCLRKISNNGVLKQRHEKQYVKDLLASMNTKYGSMENDASSLSGGNQQKIALAKWVASDCKVLIFDEPTRGVDVGAKVEIYNIMNELAMQGICIIMISSEMTELIGTCDRVVVMHQGYVTGELTREELSEESIMQLAMKEAAL